MRPRRRFTRRFPRLKLAVGLITVVWSLVEVLRVKNALVQHLDFEQGSLGGERIFVAGMHWNSEGILRGAWIPAVVDLINAVGRDNIFISIHESGSWDDTKGALRVFDDHLGQYGVPRRVIMDNTTHEDEIKNPPVGAGDGWIEAPNGEVERRRIPWLSNLRNLVLEPLYEQQKAGIVYDKILFLNDVVFTTRDIRRLLWTRGGKYAAACSLDFSEAPDFYDTFALRDSDGHEALMQGWPYFRSRDSREAMKTSQPVPVTSCWNGVVAMDSSPFYANPPLKFRGISDSLAKSHLEGSECCLIHADNPLSSEMGVWLNPNVRVGYNAEAYAAVNPARNSWLSSFSILAGLWENRILRWATTPWFKENAVRKRVSRWEELYPENTETGPFCIINEMQVLTFNGWGHR